jgi:hypothetical protein
MSMTDIVSAAWFPLLTGAAFALALAGFAMVLVTVFLGKNRSALERARFLPLEDELSRGSAARRETSHE